MSDYPPGNHKRARVRPSSSTRLVGALSVGVVAGAIAGFVVPWQAAPLIGWGVGSILWFGPIWVKVLPLDAVETSEHATGEDPTRTLSDFVLLAASIASLVAVAVVTIKGAHTHGGTKALLVGVAVGSVVASWAVVHTVFTLRYAALYYTGPDGGVDFNEDDKPSYHDFAYLAFTIGMTYQVSDTNLTTKEVRHTALRHAMISYLLGTVIIAATINLVAGLVK